MDSRRNFLRGLAQAATGAPRETPNSAEQVAAGAEAVPRPPAGAARGDGQDSRPQVRARYADALSDPRRGPEAQRALGAASVLVIGAAGLAAPVASYLAGAGVGRLGVVDDGIVELSDLHAQHLHFTPDIGVPRAHSAAAKLTFLNPEIVVEPYQVAIGPENASALLGGHDLVVDCTDDPGVRRLAGATCFAEGVALITVAVGPRSATIWFVDPRITACLECAEESSPFAVTAERAGARSAPGGFGPLLGVVGSLQALVALDALVSRAPAPPETGLVIDLERAGLQRVSAVRRVDCPVCGRR